MFDGQNSPDEILMQIKKAQAKENKGKLKIFFGYAAGVGKTYAMLKAAHDAKNDGADVVVGYIEPHTRPETSALLRGLEQLAPASVEHKGIILKEFNIDAAISRRPELILVDELAHTNAEGSRHTKRYQDIEELLNNGINVYTTVNVQHLESLNDIVASVTGIIVRERIPDKVFDNADQVQLVDIEPEALLERLEEGKIYSNVQAARAVENFFTVENLISLREIALRRTADRVNRIAERKKRNYYTEEHILVCLSSSPSNAKIIRTAARMAEAFKGKFTALFVETSAFPDMPPEDRERLRSNIRLASELGASVETVYGDDVIMQISEFVQMSGVSKLVIGRSGNKKKLIWQQNFSDSLMEVDPNLDIYIIPDTNQKPFKRERLRKGYGFSLRDSMISFALLAASTVLNFILYQIGFSEANIIMIYILGVILTAVLTYERRYSIITAIVSVLLYNFFFTHPTFTFSAYGPEYPVTFLIMFLVAFITGGLTSRIKKQAFLSAKRAYRTKILLETNQLLQQAQTNDEITNVTAHQLIRLLERTVVFYKRQDGGLSAPYIYRNPSDKTEDSVYTSKNERAVAEWTYKNNQKAGAGTSTLNGAKCTYFSVRTTSDIFGAVGIAEDKEDINEFDNSLMISILNECAAALEKKELAKKREDALLQAEHEKLRANMLRSISHDLRTPLTSISGNSVVLLNRSKDLCEEKRIKLYKNIYDDSMWLINLVENLLSVTRIEDGSIEINMVPEIVEEVISESLRHVSSDSVNHKIVSVPSEELLVARMDSKLIMQVITNIVNNAIKYTQKDSQIIISARKKGKKVLIEIADDGKGIPDEAKDRIFDMFYTGKTSSADSRRGIGLGLALCKSIVNAHGGELNVRDNEPHGTIFSFSLKAEEVPLNE